MKKLLIFLFLIAVAVTVYFSLKNQSNNKKEVTQNIDYIDYSTYNIQTEKALIDRYTIYGTYLNIGGNINIVETSIKKVQLVLINLENKEVTYDLFFTVKDKVLDFKTSQYINDGINLEKINIGNYDLLVKIVLEDERNNYYLLENQTNYDKTTYYTLTKDNSNKEIKIKFISDKIDRLNMQVTKAKLPEEVYDLVIDAGHGGDDWGTTGGKYYEKDLTLDYAKSLKDVIEEELGYKVKLTRSTDETISNYNENGRVDRINSSKAKYNLSIHLNNTGSNYYSGGLEIYAPFGAKLDFASKLATNIVNSTGINYSNNNHWRVSNGVYVRTLDSTDIKDIKMNAAKEGHEPYSIKENTTYYYIIRETGGINTNAYVDGRSQKNGENLFYLDNIGVESYLLELGYMNNASNLKSLLNNKEKYLKGIVMALKQQLIGE